MDVSWRGVGDTAVQVALTVVVKAQSLDMEIIVGWDDCQGFEVGRGFVCWEVQTLLMLCRKYFKKFRWISI